MPAKMITPIQAVEAYLESCIKEREDIIITNFSYVGERCLVEARSNGSYTDRTGNLRSSIGYVVLNNGRVTGQGGFQQVIQGGAGASHGKRFIDELISNHTKGIALIVVAGMNYAAYVEAMNYIVIDSAQLLAERLVPEIMKQLGFGVR